MAVCYVNGEFVPLERASVSILDQGFLLGDGVVDVVSAWKGVLFKLDQHVDRLLDNLAAVRIDSPLTRDGWRELLVESVRRNELQDASVRFIVTRGVPRTMHADPREHVPTTIVWPAPYAWIGDERGRREGVRLMISHLRGLSPQSLDPRYKCLDRLHFQLARLEALEAGYDDAIWLNEHGYIAEGAASNVFLVSRGVLLTPCDQVLRGITRETVLELAERAGIPWRERNLSPYDLFTADEVFTTSTAGGILPVREVNGRRPRAAVPGPITAELDRRYWAMREAGEHGTPVYAEVTDR